MVFDYLFDILKFRTMKIFFDHLFDNQIFKNKNFGYFLHQYCDGIHETFLGP